MKTKLFGASVLVAASLGIAGPASAAPICVATPDGSLEVCVPVELAPTCVGTDGTIVVCGDPDGATYISDCVYWGPPSCTQVTVTGPTVWCAGKYGSLCILPIQH